MADNSMILVTGGSRGIGAAICRRLASVGHPVAVNYASNAAAADAVVASIRHAGGTAEAIAGDVGDAAGIEAIFEAAESALGPLGHLVNNAGISGKAARLDVQDAEDLQRLFAVNVIGTMLCTAAAVRRLSTQHGGKGGGIVNIGSVAARTGGLPGIIPYAATKGAIETFTRGIANELAREGIRVNAVAPGLIATDMVTAQLAESAKGGIPVGRLGQPEEIAEAVAFLLSPAASYMTGSIMTVSGGR
jgi:NAD(P)-dependent dehydrogenase (short-subunit alcohol dehydrogenase family)